VPRQQRQREQVRRGERGGQVYRAEEAERRRRRAAAAAEDAAAAAVAEEERVEEVYREQVRSRQHVC
jgi:hypothetical protein